MFPKLVKAITRRLNRHGRGASPLNNRVYPYEPNDGDVSPERPPFYSQRRSSSDRRYKHDYSYGNGDEWNPPPPNSGGRYRDI